MIRWYWDSVMQRLGYRKVWYHPSDHGVSLGDFWSWHYRPDLPKGVYNGEKMSRRSWK